MKKPSLISQDNFILILILFKADCIFTLIKVKAEVGFLEHSKMIWTCEHYSDLTIN